jgi:hypothetical protein
MVPLEKYTYSTNHSLFYRITLEKYTYSTNHSLFYRILLCYRRKNILAPPFVAYTIVFSIFFKKKLIHGLPPTSDKEITIVFFYSNVRKIVDSFI